MISKDVLERLEKNNFAKLCGLEILEAKDGLAKCRIVLEAHHMNPIGSVHGGCIFTLMDSTSGVAAFTTGNLCTTLSSNIDYLNAARDCKEIIAEAIPVRIGKSVIVYDVNVTDENQRKISRGSFTFYVLKPLDK